MAAESKVVTVVSRIPFAGRINVEAAALEPWPLARETIVRGAPQASGHVFSRSADGRMLSGIWDCTPGSFLWNWDYDETFVVLSGRAVVHIVGGPDVELKPGDLACFERGQSATWETVEHMRKAFHASAPEPLPF